MDDTRPNGDQLSPAQRSTLRRAIAASAVGNATEWFDYTIYALLAVRIGEVFFAGSSPAAQALSVYGVFALSFVARPFGGILLGPLGDRIGRQRVLAFTIVLMSGATFVIGVLPGYGQIGVLAPAALVLCRLVQGFSTGGEYSGAAIFMAEYAPTRKRGFYGSFLEFGTLASWVVGTGIVTLLEFGLDDAAMQAWGWRVPFLIAGPLGVVGLYLRTRLEDTPVFRELAESAPRPSVGSQARAVLRHWRSLLVCVGMVCMLNVTAYVLRSYMPGYLEGPVGLSANSTLLVLLTAFIGSMILIVPVGAFSDRVGRKPLWYASGVGIFVLAVPAFALLTQGWALAVLGLLVLDLLFLLQLATISATFPTFFPTEVRYAGLAISYNISTSLFGGTAPIVNTALIEATGTRFWPAFSVMAACVIGLVALRFAPETAGKSMRTVGVLGDERTRC